MYTFKFQIIFRDFCSDLERVREGTGHKFVMIIQYLSTFFSGIIVGLYVNARMTLITLCVGPFIVALTAYGAKVSTYKSNKK